MRWKFLHKGRGLLVASDEAEVIGVFHCDRKASAKRKDEIRRLLVSADDMRSSLRQLAQLYTLDAEGKPMLRSCDQRQILEQLNTAQELLDYVYGHSTADKTARLP